MIPNNIQGKRYEAMATSFLKQKGYEIIKNNYSNKLGEIDIICKDNDIYVFVEVKFRTSSKLGRPIEAITAQKLHKITMTATKYLKEHKLLDSQIRFDAIEILNDEIRHIENII